MTLTAIVKSFAPYDTMEAFGRGFVDYLRGQHGNPHHADSVAAQAWDRGHMAGSLAKRHGLA
jgi:hypothetical protein